MAGAGVMEFQSAVIRTPSVAHMTAAQVLTHHRPMTTSGAAYGIWETRESSPMSVDNRHQSQMTKESIERTLNFSTSPHEDEYGYGKKKTAPRDPMSHRIIEKRRRDRMNNCLADLSRLIPSSYLRKGRGRIEKTEIIEMAIKHIRYLQNKVSPGFSETDDQSTPVGSPAQDKDLSNAAEVSSGSYAGGYKDCIVEVLHYLVDVEGFFVSEGSGSRLLNHMQNRMDRMGHDIDIREHIPQELLHPLKHTRDSSLESESRTNLRNACNGQKDLSSSLPMGHRSRAMSQSEALRGIRISSDYDSEQECQASGVSSNNSRGSPRSSSVSRNQNQLAPESQEAKNSSQLREMLQSPFNTWGRNYRPLNNVSGGEMETVEPNKPVPQNPSIGQSSSPSSTSMKEPDTTPSSYNFKRNIKERFKEELRRTSEPEIKVEDDPLRLGKRRPDSRSSGSNDSLNEAQDSLIPPEFITSGANKRRASGSPNLLSSSTVPIFALHSSGAYYVPSSISTNAIEFDPEPAKGTPSICHPVTINVNFSTSAHTSQGASLITAPGFQYSRTPMFFNAQQFLTANQMPFIQNGQLPFLSPVAGMGMPMIQQNGTPVLRRGSLPLGPSKEPAIHYGFVSSPQPLIGANNVRTSPHILNLSQPHTRI